MSRPQNLAVNQVQFHPVYPHHLLNLLLNLVVKVPVSHHQALKVQANLLQKVPRYRPHLLFHLANQAVNLAVIPHLYLHLVVFPLRSQPQNHLVCLQVVQNPQVKVVRSHHLFHHQAQSLHLRVFRNLLVLAHQVQNLHLNLVQLARLYLPAQAKVHH